MGKSILVASALSLVLGLAGCQNKDNKTTVKTAVEIPDAKFKAYLVENFDLDKDGNISSEEAKKIESIDCSGMDIEDLTGIEKFSNLKMLDCRNNKLMELDLQNNAKLEKAICTGNGHNLSIYISMSSPLRNKDIQRPKDNSTPDELASAGLKPWDESKLMCDPTNMVVLSFE